jgi:putative transposase
MIKSFRIKLITNNKQRTKLFLFAGAARYAYNWALEEEQKEYKNSKKFLSDSELRKRFTQHKKLNNNFWLRNISNDVMKQAIKDACNAYKNFFKHQSRFPRFKSKKRSTPSFYQDPIKIKFTSTHVKLEKISDSKRKNRRVLNYIRLAERDRIPTGVKYFNPRITYDGLNWWISVSIEYHDSDNKPCGESIGIDLGIKNLAICSDNNTYHNINKSKQVKSIEKKKRRLQRRISRKYDKNKIQIKGGVFRYYKTKNIIKDEKLLLKMNHRLTNIRKNYLHQVTSEIIKREPSFICLENLNVSGMLKNKHLSKAIQEECFYEFRRQIEYKSKERNIIVIFAPMFYPSSKLCSCCGYIKKDLKLSNRIYRCPKCGNVIDRDLQAAINLRNYGEQQLQNLT